MRRALAGVTARGRGLLLTGVAATAVAVAVGQTDLLRAGVLLLVLPLASVYLVGRSRVRLRTSRTIEPLRVAAGEPALVRLHLENDARVPTGVLLVEDRLPPAFGARPRFVLDRVWSRWSRDVTYTVHPQVRGHYPIGPLTVRVTDPFGLVEARRELADVDAVVVTPPVHPLLPIPLTGEWSGSGESRPRSVAAAGQEDSTVRPYTRGDDVRRVHWKASAHQGELMVRREEQPWQSRAVVLLDTRAGGHAGSALDSSFEWAVAAAASVAVHLLGAGFSVRLVTDTGGSVAIGWHDPASGPGAAEGLVLDALAVVALDRGASVGAWSALLAGGEAGSGTLVAVLGDLSTDEAVQVAQLRQEGMVAAALLLDVGSFGLSPAARTAADARRAEATTVLRGAGWRVVEAAWGEPVPLVWQRLGTAVRVGMDGAA